MFALSHPTVGNETYEIIDVSCPGMGEFRNNVAPPSIIWDRVMIELSVRKARVNVGTRLSPSYEAYYEFDETVFVGDVTFNTDLQSDIVRDKDITIQSIREANFDLESYVCNVINVIWDKVIIELDIRDDRLQVGSDARISERMWYSYNQTPFFGQYELNDTTTRITPEIVNYRVSRITDPQWGLTSFETNVVSCTFDSVKIEQEFYVNTPTQLKIITKVMFQSDDAPVENAMVDVNGFSQHVGDGVYESTISTLLPTLEVNTKVTASGYETIFTHRNVTLIGNVFMESAVIIFFSAVVSIQAYRSYKKAQKWKEDLKNLEDMLIRNNGVEVNQAATSFKRNEKEVKKLFLELLSRGSIQGELVKNESRMLLDEVPIKSINRLGDVTFFDFGEDLDIISEDAERIILRLNSEGSIQGRLVYAPSGTHFITDHYWNSYLTMLKDLLYDKKGVEIRVAVSTIKVEAEIIKQIFHDLISRRLLRGELVKNETVMLLDEVPLKRIQKKMEVTMDELSKELDITKPDAERIIKKLYNDREFAGRLVQTQRGLHVFTDSAWNRRLQEFETQLRRTTRVALASLSRSMSLAPETIRLLFTDLQGSGRVNAELVSNGTEILPDEEVSKKVDELDSATFRKLAQALGITSQEAEKITLRLKGKKEIEVHIGFVCPNCRYLHEEGLSTIQACLKCDTPFGNWEKGFESSGTKIFR